jgi:hypothetical protein
MITVYLWKAGSARGVTDDSKQARRQAARSMRENGAAEAVVVTAYFDDELNLMDPGYVNGGGMRWEARRHGSRIFWHCRWVPAPKPGPALAAS